MTVKARVTTLERRAPPEPPNPYRFMSAEELLAEFCSILKIGEPPVGMELRAAYDWAAQQAGAPNWRELEHWLLSPEGTRALSS